MHPLWLLGGEKNYSNNGCLLGLLPLAAKSMGCLFWPEVAQSVGSGIRAGDCVGPEEGLLAGVEF